MPSWRLIVSGAPRTKKTSNVLAVAGRRRVVLPSAAWRRWRREATILVNGAPIGLRLEPLLTAPVNCRALFYRDADRGDAVGYYQGLADLLEERCILGNDRQLVSWDGSRLLIDRAHPRVEILLEAVP